jgi:hypothetical protein
MIQKVKPTRESLLVIIPPEKVCDQIDKIRSVYDRAYEKGLPPHISIFMEVIIKKLITSLYQEIIYTNTMKNYKTMKRY